jgi:hypothetical protein
MSEEAIIEEQLENGWIITNENNYSTTMEKRKTFWWIWLFLFGVFYLSYYFATKDEKKTIRKTK